MILNIKGKILAGTGVIILLLLGVCTYLVINMKNMDNNYTAIISHEAAAYSDIQGALAQYNEAGARLFDYVIAGNADNIDLYLEAIKDGDANLNKVAASMDTEEEKQLFNNLKNKVSAFKEYGNQMLALVKTREAALNQDNHLAADKQLMEYKKSHNGVMNNVTLSAEALAKLQAQLLANSQKQTMASADNAVRVSIITIVVIILLGLIIALFVAQMIANPIRLVDSQAARIAAGDLSGNNITIKSKDEAGRLAESFNIMHQNLIGIAQQLQKKSQNVAASAADLSASAENVSAGATETATTITQVATTVDQITGNTQHISEASARSANLAREGSEGLQDVEYQMDMIQQTAIAAGDVVNGLSAAAGKITQIVELITQIADQTNLLALNAAIEAARAGEQGRGFAVVADEVRKLAEQSANAAKEIRSLIINVQQESQKAVQRVEQNAAQVEAGATKIRDMKALFEEIIESVQDLAGEIQQVAAATEQMSASVQNVAATTEEQTAAMEEVSSTTQSLAGLADELETLSLKFKLA